MTVTVDERGFRDHEARQWIGKDIATDDGFHGKVTHAHVSDLDLHIVLHVNVAGGAYAIMTDDEHAHLEVV